MAEFIKKIFCVYIFFTISSNFLFCSSIVAPTIYSKYNSSCNSTFPCDPTSLLACVGSICHCDSPSNQIYDPLRNICKSTVGGACTMKLESESQQFQKQVMRPCIENAKCVSILTPDGLNYTECQCIHNHIENSSGSCVPGLGQACNYKPNECNPLGMIVCKNNICQCLDNLQVYDEEFHRCVSPVGTHCKLDSVQLGCVKNAICYPFYYWLPPKCLCKPGFIQSAKRTCLPDSSYHHS